MEETTYLAGRVVRSRLPVYDGPPPPGAPELKRLRLPKGDLTQVHNSDEPLRYLAWLELRAGAVRGNHYHEFKQESVYVIEGVVEVTVVARDTGEREAIPLLAGDLLFIPAGVAHALRTLEPGQALEFAPEPLDVSDSYPFPVVE